MDTQHNSPNPATLFERNSPENPDKYETNMSKSEDDSDFMENDNDNLLLQKGQTFESFEEVENFLTQYCEQKGFEYRKRRVEYDDDNIIRKRTYECTKAAQYQPKKNKDPEKHRNRSSGSIGCQWHLNVTCPKSTNVIKITTVVTNTTIH